MKTSSSPIFYDYMAGEFSSALIEGYRCQVSGFTQDRFLAEGTHSPCVMALVESAVTNA
jgi:hypothetical protein